MNAATNGNMFLVGASVDGCPGFENGVDRSCRL